MQTGIPTGGQEMPKICVENAPQGTTNCSQLPRTCSMSVSVRKIFGAPFQSDHSPAGAVQTAFNKINSC